MLPEDILENGVDADGDGVVSLKTSVPDALVSGAAMLRDLGWRPNEPWLQEVVVPEGLDWAQTGLDTKRPGREWRAAGRDPAAGRDRADLPASVLLPQGRNGPAFLAYPNFDVLFEWNQSFVYVTTAAYFATRLEGAPVYDAGDPAPGLIGGRDEGAAAEAGGARPRRGRGRRHPRREDPRGGAGRAGRLGLPADAWPTRELLRRL